MFCTSFSVGRRPLDSSNPSLQLASSLRSLVYCESSLENWFTLTLEDAIFSNLDVDFFIAISFVNLAVRSDADADDFPFFTPGVVVVSAMKGSAVAGGASASASSLALRHRSLCALAIFFLDSTLLRVPTLAADARTLIAVFSSTLPTDSSIDSSSNRDANSPWSPKYAHLEDVGADERLDELDDAEESAAMLARYINSLDTSDLLGLDESMESSDNGSARFESN